MKMVTDKIESRIKLQEKVILKHHKEMQKHFGNYKDIVTTVNAGNRRMKKISSMNDIYDPHLHLSSPRRGYVGMYLSNVEESQTERVARPYSLSPTLKTHSDPSNSNASSRYSSPSARKFHAIEESKRIKNGYVDIHDFRASRTEKKGSTIRKINLDTPVYQRQHKTETPIVSGNMIYFEPYGGVSDSQEKLTGMSLKYPRSNTINEEYKALYLTLHDELEMMKEQQQREVIKKRLSLQDSDEIKESKKHMDMMKEQMDYMQKQMEKVVRHVEAINVDTMAVVQSQAPVRLQQNNQNDQKHKRSYHILKHSHNSNQKTVTKHQHLSHHQHHEPKPSEESLKSQDQVQQSYSDQSHHSSVNHHQQHHAGPKHKQPIKKQNDNHQHSVAKSHVIGNNYENDHVSKYQSRNLQLRKPENNSCNIKQNGHIQHVKQKDFDHSSRKRKGNNSDTKHDNKTNDGDQQTHAGRNHPPQTGSHTYNEQLHNQTGKNQHTHAESQPEQKAEALKQKLIFKKSPKKSDNQKGVKQTTNQRKNSNPGKAQNIPKKGSLKKSESFRIMGRSKNFFGYLSLTDDNLKNRKRRVQFSEEGERPGTA